MIFAIKKWINEKLIHWRFELIMKILKDQLLQLFWIKKFWNFRNFTANWILTIFEIIDKICKFVNFHTNSKHIL